jgi:hypothetical protein
MCSSCFILNALCRFPVPWQPTLKNRGLRRTFLCRAEEEGKSSEGAPVETKVENKEVRSIGALDSSDGWVLKDGYLSVSDSCI